ncbi:PREDICTED: uncharacterized protein LOC105453232 [Wasmannia auropunctata]|uniref:uncharacterized protein LOC105453232 n=1 Tax=Wasmannia auropunctata TaxID=64793 RepID=UPI0005ED4B2B|nr:PREDICTED: uncharacterized protein LOC105453232 [Wasmannia auropunctata]
MLPSKITIKRSATHLGTVGVYKKLRRGRKRNKKRQSELTTDFNTFEVKPTIFKMRIPLLILCLTVVYGACRSTGEESFDVAEQIQDNGHYKVAQTNVPYEIFLARHKRANLLSPITFPIETALRLIGFNNGIIAPFVDVMKFMTGALTGQDVCPKVQVQLSCQLIVQAFTNPLQTIKTVVCRVLQLIGSTGNAVVNKMFDTSVLFCRNVFLPGMHTTLNVIKDNIPFLPPQIVAMIVAFNALYTLLQLIGYVPK